MSRRKPHPDDVAAVHRRLAALLGDPTQPRPGHGEPRGTDLPTEGAAPLTLRAPSRSPGPSVPGRHKPDPELESTRPRVPDGSRGGAGDEAPAGPLGSGVAARVRGWSGRAGDRLAVGSVTPQHVVVVVLAVLVALAIGTWWALRSAPHSQPLSNSGKAALIVQHTPRPGTTSPTGAGSTGQAGTASTASTASSMLVVDVAGKVRHPGIVDLPAGSRVIDALRAAGGALPGVSLTSLNLASPLADGEQILVGLPAAAPPSAGGVSAPTSTGATVAPVDINTATEAQLESLPDIGPVTAQAILDWRLQNGAFHSVDDLLAVSGIGDATLADIRPYVYV